MDIKRVEELAHRQHCLVEHYEFQRKTESRRKTKMEIAFGVDGVKEMRLKLLDTVIAESKDTSEALYLLSDILKAIKKNNFKLLQGELK